jgi:hypothetical protein
MDFAAAQDGSHSFVAVAMLMLFSLTMVLVMMNLMIAIMSEAIEEVKADARARWCREQHEMLQRAREDELEMLPLCIVRTTKFALRSYRASRLSRFCRHWCRWDCCCRCFCSHRCLRETDDQDPLDMYRKLRVFKVKKRLQKSRRDALQQEGAVNMGNETKSSGGVASVKEVDTTALTVDDDGPGVCFHVSIGESLEESARGLVMSGGKVVARRVTLQEGKEEIASVVKKTLKRATNMKPSDLSKKNFSTSKQTKLAKQNNEVVQNEVHQTLRTFMYGLALMFVFAVAVACFARRWRVAQNHNHTMPFTKNQLSPTHQLILLTTVSCALCMPYRCLQVQSAASRDLLCGPVQK